MPQQDVESNDSYFNFLGESSFFPLSALSTFPIENEVHLLAVYNITKLWLPYFLPPFVKVEQKKKWML